MKLKGGSGRVERFCGAKRTNGFQGSQNIHRSSQGTR